MKVLIILLLASLVIIPSSLEAFAQVEQTKGENYDLIENFNIGEANWKSHPDRIMNGVWENYVLTDGVDKVIFNTNAVGSLVYDKNSCSYSIYENGYNGNQIIPSISAMASFQDSVGVWSNLPVNNQACAVEVIPYEDGVFLTSTKVITENTTEDVFVPISAEVFYSNSTLSNFTLITDSTGGTGYFNGDEVTMPDQSLMVVDKFVQELDLNINSGFKETFKVWHTGDEALGITQTVHTGESITMGETVIPIAQYSGQSFDRQYLEDNKVYVFEITDQLNYDFDIGFQSLSNVNIIFDETYKVNLDYANGDDGVPFVGYLEIDPTIITTGSGTFDITPLHNHIISSGTIDAVTLTGTQITNLQNDITALNQYHTLSGTTLIVSYTVPTITQPPTGLSITSDIPLGTSWTAPIDDGDSSITGYKVYRSDSVFTQTELPNSSGSDGELTFTDNEMLIHGFPISDSSVNAITITATAGTTTSGTIGTAIQSPDLTYTDTNLPDNTDILSVGGYVKLDSSTDTKLLGLGEITFNVLPTSASVDRTIPTTVTGNKWGTSVSPDDTTIKFSSGNYVNNVAGSTHMIGYTVSPLITKTDDKLNWKYPSMTRTAWTSAHHQIDGAVWESVLNGDWVWNVKMSSGISYTQTSVYIYLNNGDYIGSLDYSTSTKGIYPRVINSAGFDDMGTIDPFNVVFSKTGDVYEVCYGATCRQETSSTGIDYIQIGSAQFKNYGYGDIFIETTNLSGDSTTYSLSNIISATSLTDNTATPQHYAFTRDSSNGWAIYQNGISKATATDTTSLGSNVGNNYSTKLSGSLDEFFINSDTLSSTEIAGIADRGAVLTPLTTTTATTYDDNSVVGGNTYYYSVKAQNAIGLSDYLTPFVSGLAGTPPNPSTGVTASIPDTATAPLDVTVSFSPSATVGSGTVTGFQLLRDGVAVTTGGLVTSLDDTAPAGGTEYAYTVITLGTHGNSVASASSSVTTPNTPAQVVNLALTPVSASRIDLSWDTPSANNSLISGYKVQISSNGGSSYTDVLTGNVNTSYQALSLSGNAQYHFKVSAINGVGTGTASAVSNTYTMTPTPATLTATAVSEVQINLAWGASTGSTGYKIEYESPTGNGFTTHTSDTGDTDLTASISGLTTGTQYNFRVSGLNAGGASVASPEASSYTWGVLQAPVIDTITRMSPTSLKLDFTTGTGLPVATGYLIERQTGAGWIELIADTGNTDVTYTDYVLSSDQSATYRIYAINSIGTSPVSNEKASDAVASSGGGGGSSSSKAVSSQTGVSGLVDLTFIDQIHRVVLGQFLSKSINVAWDTSDNLEVKSIIVSDSPFRIVFQDVPFVLLGDPSGISNGKINYSVQIPNELCTTQGQVNCVEQKQYDIPVEIKTDYKGTTLTKSSVIKIDLAGGSDIPLVFVLLAIGAVPLAFIIRKVGSGKKKRKASGSSHKSSKNGSNSKKVSL